jgi:hypothetical protein
MTFETTRTFGKAIPYAIVLFVAFCVSVLRSAPAEENPLTEESGAPVVLGPRYGGTVLLADGTMRRFVSESVEDGVWNNYTVDSTDSGRTWGKRAFAYKGLRASLPLLDRDGEFHVFPMKVRITGEPRRIAVNYFIDIWHVKTSGGGTTWGEPQAIFEGYVGSVNCVTQLSSGRIVVPFGEWIGGRPADRGERGHVCVLGRQR